MQRERRPAPRTSPPAQTGGETGGAVADHGGEDEDGEMAEKLAEHDLPARHRIGQQQRHGSALDLADDGVIGQQ